AEPADPRRQALEGDPLAGEPDPTPERLVVSELLEDGAVGGGDIRGLARQRRPAEWTLALAEERPDVGGDEAGVVEGALKPPELRLGAEAVAVVEDLGAGVLVGDHREAVGGDGGARAAYVLLGVGPTELRRLVEVEAGWDISAQRIVGGGLVGDDVGGKPAIAKRGQ